MFSLKTRGVGAGRKSQLWPPVCSETKIVLMLLGVGENVLITLFVTGVGTVINLTCLLFSLTFVLLRIVMRQWMPLPGEGANTGTLVSASVGKKGLRFTSCFKRAKYELYIIAFYQKIITFIV